MQGKTFVATQVEKGAGAHAHIRQRSSSKTDKLHTTHTDTHTGRLTHIWGIAFIIFGYFLPYHNTLTHTHTRTHGT